MSVTMGNLFSGSGAWELAAKICGIDVVFEAEIEPFPVAVEAKRFPEAIQLGDVSKINGAEIPVVDILTNSSPCFTADSLVRTSEGMKPIAEIRKGEWVVTHNGRWREVLDCGCTGEKEVVRLNAMGLDEITATANHPFYVRHMSRYYPSFYENGKRKRSSHRRFSEPEWKPLGELTKFDYIGIPTLQKEEFDESLEMDEELLWLVGRYIADGYRKKGQYTVTFCIGERKYAEFMDHIKKYEGYLDKCRTACKYGITSQVLWNFCGECGDLAMNKHLPSWVWKLSANGIKKLLEGYFDGDGCCTRNGIVKATTISRRLAYDLALAIATVYNAPCRLCYTHRPPTCVIEGRTVNQHDTYQIAFKTNKGKQDQAFYEDGYVWLPIRSVVRGGKEKVYNLTVEEDNSYTVQNIAVHNCQDLSVAGKREGLGGERSGLFSQTIRICKEMRDADRRNADINRRDIRPRFFCWENVPGALSSSEGEDFRTVIEQVARLVKEDANILMPPRGWSNCGVVDVGCGQIAWRIMDAQFFGVPQRRRRVFLIGDLNGHRAGEILFERESVSWNFAEIAETWKDTSRSIADRIETASEIVRGGVRKVVPEMGQHTADGISRG